MTPSPKPEKKSVHLWLPTNETKVTVINGEVTVWDEMVMEKRLLQKPAGFAGKEGE